MSAAFRLRSSLWTSLWLCLMPLDAVEIDVATELGRIDSEATILAKPFVFPGEQLERKFRNALEDLESSARASGDGPTLKAVRDALWKLDSDDAWTGDLSHPEVRRLTFIYRKARRGIDEKYGALIDRSEQDMRAAYRTLEHQLDDAGQSEDAGIVRKVIEKSLTESARRKLAALQIRDAAMEGFETPSLMASRLTPESRARAVEWAGGSEATERAVLAGLRHLAATQSPDGSWQSARPHYAMAGLGLLAFLGHGDGPWSDEFASTTQDAITYLVRAGLEKKGVFASGPEPNPMPYEHAIATYALAEAAILCASEQFEIPGLRSVVRQAGQHIINNQHKSGGWDYAYRTDTARGGDLSITAWQLQALHVCSLTGIDFGGLTEATLRGLDYVESCQKADGGFGYKPSGSALSPNGYATLTGVGVLLHQLLGKKSAAAARKGAKYIQKESRFRYHTSDSDLYGHFYEARAMYLRGGDEWKAYHKMVFPDLLEAQDPDGSWPPPGNGEKLNAVAASYQSNAHYRNCLCLLILESYYRTAPTIPAEEAE